MRQGIFLPESSFSADSLTVSVHPHVPPHAFKHTHVKNLVINVKVGWIRETLKHQACTKGWVARLCCSWLSLGKANKISHGRNPTGTIQMLIKNSANNCSTELRAEKDTTLVKSVCPRASVPLHSCSAATHKMTKWKMVGSH